MVRIRVNRSKAGAPTGFTNGPHQARRPAPVERILLLDQSRRAGFAFLSLFAHSIGRFGGRFHSGTLAGTGAAFAHFCAQKASGDKAVTSGDKLSGLEFEAFPARKRISEHGEHLEPVFEGKRAKLEARAHFRRRTQKKRTLRTSPFSALFLRQKRSGDKDR